jgi:hypothetical protein
MVPIGFAAHPVYALRSWDRFRIPWPFARVLVSHGAPFEPAAWPAAQAAGTPGAAAAAQAAGVPGASDVAECARLAFERALAAVTRDVRTRMGERL